MKLKTCPGQVVHVGTGDDRVAIWPGMCQGLCMRKVSEVEPFDITPALEMDEEGVMTCPHFVTAERMEAYKVQPLNWPLIQGGQGRESIKA